MPLADTIRRLANPLTVSDLWFSPGERIAIEGVLPRSVTETVLGDADWAELTALCGLGERPCDKNATVVIGDQRYRVNFFVAQGKARAALRLIRGDIPVPSALRVPKQVIDAVCRHTDGIVIIAGATGSGKSTTLASLLQEWARQHSGHIVTLEDPVEYLLQGQDPLQFSQREVGRDVESFSSGLASALRQSPKIILVQEIRDPESALAAINAAQTGHLVLTTLHTGRVKQSIQSFLKLIPEGRLDHATHAFASCFKAIVCQRLVRTDGGPGKERTRFAIHEVAMATRTISNHIQRSQFDLIENEIITGRSSGHQTFELSIDNAINERIIPTSAKKPIMDTL